MYLLPSPPVCERLFFLHKVPTPTPHFKYRLYRNVNTSKALLVTLVGIEHGEGAGSHTPSSVGGGERRCREGCGEVAVGGGRWQKELTVEACLGRRKTRNSPRPPARQSLLFL